jgi:hypothetical protein
LVPDAVDEPAAGRVHGAPDKVSRFDGHRRRFIETNQASWILNKFVGAIKLAAFVLTL